MLRAGVIGAGWAARSFHLPAYSANPSVELVAVADPDEDRRTQVSREFSIPTGYRTGEELLNAADVDAVSICTPPNTHEELFLAAVDHRCHVHCEKPLATSAAAANRMATAADDAGVVTQMGYKLKFYANYERVLTLVDNDMLGGIQRAFAPFHSTPPATDWYFDPQVSGGGAVADLLPHVLDFYLDLFGRPPEVESATTAHHDVTAVEDSADVRLRFDETPVYISIGWDDFGELSQSVVVGRRGWVKFDQKHLTGSIEGADLRFKYGQPPAVDIEIEQLYLAPDESEQNYTKRVDDFVTHALRGDPGTRAPASRGVEVLRVVEEIYRRAET